MTSRPKSAQKTILFIGHSPDFYGAEKVLFQVIDSVRSDFCVHVVLPGRGGMWRRLEILSGVTLHQLDLPRFSLAMRDILATIFGFLPFLFLFGRLLVRVRPDLLYGTTIRTVLPLAVARLLGYRSLIHFHEHNVPGPVGQLLPKLACRASERLLFVCRYALESYAASCPGLRSRSRVIYNGVPPQESAANVPCPTEFTDRFPRLLTIGQLAEHKRIGDLLEALPQIVARYPAAALVVLGDGELRDKLRTRARELGLDKRVFLPGYVNDTGPFLKNADIVLAPFAAEACNMVVLESMAAGKPVLAADGGGMPELIEQGRSGLLYPGGIIAALVENVLRLADNPALRDEMGRAAQQRAAEEFSLDGQMATIRGEIEGVLAGKKRS